MKKDYTGRCILLTICILQMISTGERQLFDFLGRMWLPILVNFFNFIFVIFGFFGAYQYKTRYVIVYLTWMFVWLAWNIFVICFYLNMGALDNDSDWLNFGTGSASWWEINGIGCDPIFPTNLTEVDISRPLRPDVVKNCVLDYQYVETIHAAIQCCFIVPGIIVAIYLIKKFSTQDEACKKKPASIYYVEYSSQREGSESPDLDLVETPYPQPMTPRKVKRQSRHRASGRSSGRSTTERSHHSRTGSQGRSSQRHRRPQYLNPVTQLIDKANESSTSTDSFRKGPPIRPPTYGGRQGHSNPMYVHSRPNSAYSLHESSSPLEPVERPPSVHSSYSNYHGQRASINTNPNATKPVIKPNGGVPYSQNSFFAGNANRLRSNEVRSTFGAHPTSFGHTPLKTNFGVSKESPYSEQTSIGEPERPPPYMFGVNSETVI